MYLLHCMPEFVTLIQAEAGCVRLNKQDLRWSVRA